VLSKNQNLLWVSFWFIFIIDYFIALFLLSVYSKYTPCFLMTTCIIYLKRGKFCPTTSMWWKILVQICLYSLNCTKFGQLVLRKNWSHQMSDFKAKMHQISIRLGLCPRLRWGSLQRFPEP